MDESTLWGSIGVLIAIVGVGIIATDHEFVEALNQVGFASPLVWYGVAVGAAALLAAVVILPSIALGR